MAMIVWDSSIQIAAALLKIEAQFEENRSGDEDDFEFHSAIFAATRNALLPHIGEIIFTSQKKSL